MESPLFLALAAIVIAIEAGRLILAIVRPGPAYRIYGAEGLAAGSDEFVRQLEPLTDARVCQFNSVEVLTNGECFYEAELEAIAQARDSVHLAAYIFERGRTADRFVARLAERAAAGVEVRLLLDAVGSITTPRSYFRMLLKAGGRVEWYHPLRWNTWPHINNRSHQEIIVIDGVCAFAGGAGVADYWERSGVRGSRWRDTMFRITGDAATGLQAAFAINWLEAAGELLAGETCFPCITEGGPSPALVVNSAPTQGGSTHARVLFQMLLHAAQKKVRIATPYFLPDKSARNEMIRAVQERGVELEILVPGRHAVPFLTRRCSRRLYGQLLQAGARIYEFQPAMMHVKTMVVDGLWAVFGSTNFDPRSFGINDEINVAVRGEELAARLDEDFERDLAESRPIDYEEWRKRPWWERVTELFSAVFERQQ